MKYKNLLGEIGKYVRDKHRMEADKRLIYHDFRHTESVVKKTMQMARHYKLNDTDFFAVTAAAWFHDLGYLVSPHEHEQKGAELALEFLKVYEVDEQVIALVEQCILATRVPQVPSTLMEQIICDADLFHLGTKKFFKNDLKLRKEKKALCGLDIPKFEWYQQSISFLEAHHYFTDYCQLVLADKQRENLRDLREQLDMLERKEKKEFEDQKLHHEKISDAQAGHHKPAKDETVENKKDRPEKGVETMFKISSNNHQRLSAMADNKAHIMITVNSIILSAIISLVLRKLNEYNYLLIPTCILLAVSLLAMTFSILATRPSIPGGTFLRSDVDDKKVNLLFFGNFFRMQLVDFTYGMERMMEDHELLYGSLIRDVYAQGVVLGKKYRLLRAAYNTFMFGLIGAVAAFLIASVFFSHPVIHVIK